MAALTSLNPKSMGAGALFAHSVSASSPATVAFGGIPVTFLATQVIGTAAGFILLTLALVFAFYSYAAAAQHIQHPAAAYALIGQGLSRALGVGAGYLALVSYSAIEISLFGLIGGQALGGENGLIGGPWWIWALLAWAIITVVSILAPGLSVGVIVTVLVAQFAALIGVTVMNLRSGPITFEAFSLDALIGQDAAGQPIATGAALAFCMAAFIGFESSASFGEEAKSHAIRRASLAVVLVAGSLYAITAWSMTVAAGPGGVVEAVANGALPFGPLGSFAPAAVVVFALAMVTAMLAFHNTVARYLFALGREGIMPRWMDRTSGNGTPVAGSLVQSGVSLLVIGVFVGLGLDPVGQLFTWLSTGAALGVLALIATCSLAAASFLYRRHENVLTASFVPVVGVMLAAVALALMADNVDALLGPNPGTVKEWMFGALAAATLFGIAQGVILRFANKGKYRQLGRVTPDPHEFPDRRLVGPHTAI